MSAPDPHRSAHSADLLAAGTRGATPAEAAVMGLLAGGQPAAGAPLGRAPEAAGTAPRTKPVMTPMPPSAALAQARAFLPALAQANAALAAELEAQPLNRERFDVEAVGDDEPHIEMDLMPVELDKTDAPNLDFGEEEEDDDDKDGMDI